LQIVGIVVKVEAEESPHVLKTLLIEMIAVEALMLRNVHLGLQSARLSDRLLRIVAHDVPMPLLKPLQIDHVQRGQALLLLKLSLRSDVSRGHASMLMI
jgi:hypothetical protein